MTCEGVYQSVRCWEFSELIATPCQSLIVPQVHHGTRPMASWVAATSARASAIRATVTVGPGPLGAPDRFRSGAASARVPASAGSDARIHPPRVEDPRRVERRLDAVRQAHQGLGLRLEHVDRGPYLGR